MDTPDRIYLYRLTLAYNGYGFHGWQSQSDGSGIQDIVEKHLATILRYSVRVVAASRTDSGVHAEDQTATIKLSQPLEDCGKVLRSVNALLPTRVRIKTLEQVPEDFHPMYSSLGKIYRYRIWNGALNNPFLEPYVWVKHESLNLDLMQQAAQAFVGTHDFTSFCAVDSSAKNKSRTIFEVKLEVRGPLINFWIAGDGFLKQMVRTIVGTLVWVGKEQRPGSVIADILGAQDRTAAAKTAPAQGLSLVQIFYGTRGSIAEAIAKADCGFTLKS